MEEEFINRIEDIYNRCNNRNIITCTNFLTPTEQSIIETRNYKNVILKGGGTLCERRRAFFLPDYITEDIFEINEYITALKISFSFSKLSHRDFLGTFMGLKIKRECIGDIYVFEKFAYVYINKEIAQYVLLNLRRIGNVGVTVEEVDINSVIVPEIKTEKITFTVNSLRLDSIVAGTFKISRENATERIKEGLVMVNYLETINPSKMLKQDDILSLRGHGKAKLVSIGSISKKGRIFISLEKMI